ncbi:MAG: Hsp33 family molecular chaperone HslO [Firmicutes bacterium]|jgi:molecular chaperone Hsp33|nr:Hsp33 family molecular chaperone HslO [Bacillota bacterium]
MKDELIRAIGADGAVRAFVTYTKDMVQQARTLHHTAPVATAALGRLLTAGCMMGSTLKGEKDLITLQIRGDGPLQGIVVTADSKGRTKGYVFQPNVEIPNKCKGKLDVSGAIGNGVLRIIKDIGMKEPYSGEIELVTGEIAEDLTYYFAQSEQTPSAVGLGVLVDRDTSVKQAGGFIVQLMPDTEEEIVAQLEKNISEIPYITDLYDMGKTPEDILAMLLKGLEPKITDRTDICFYCNCTRERVEKALISIGKQELEKIIEEDKQATLHCHFCAKEYHFEQNELISLLESAK